MPRRRPNSAQHRAAQRRAARELADLDPADRRLLNSRRRKGERADEHLVELIQRGEIRRKNIRPGTRGEQAYRRVQYLSRQEGRPEGVTAREMAGHEAPSVRAGRSISVMVEAPGGGAEWVVLTGVTRAEASRAAKYESLVAQLRAGRITPARFEKRVSSWRPIHGRTFLADADAVLALNESRRAAELPTFEYTSGRAA